MSEKIGIIADDFTGANDTGVQLAKKGYSSSVQLMESGLSEDQAETDAWIIDTDSRSASAHIAYSRVLQETKALKKKGIKHFYKKIDSTLRGNIGPELQAMEEVTGAEIIVIAPAFPKVGRTTAEGYHYVEGRLIAETEFGQDPKTPVRHSYIPDLLLPEGRGKTVVATAERLNSPAVSKWVTQQLEEGKNWFVCDAVSEEDLARIADVFGNEERRIVWAGSAGLMEQLSFGEGNGRAVTRINPDARQILTVSGSLSGRTSAQLEALSKRKGTVMIEVDPVMLVKKEVEPAAIMKRIQEKREWDTVVLFVASTEENRKAIQQLASESGRKIEEAGKAISAGLGLLSKEILERFPIDGLIMTGGDTAKDICSVLEAPKMELLQEVEPGLPFGSLSLAGRKLWAITKAGGFGNSASLVRAVDFLKGENDEYEPS